MLLEETQVQSRLDSPLNLANKFGKGNRKNHVDAGRKNGDVNLHPVVRNVISAAAHLSTAKEVSQDFDVSPAQVHNLKHGKVTGTGEVHEEILDGKKNILSEVHSKAINILMKSLNLVDDDEKLKTLKATSLTNIAKDMASIIDKTSEKSESAAPKVIIVTAARRELKDYQVLEIESTVVE